MHLHRIFAVLAVAGCLMPAAAHAKPATRFYAYPLPFQLPLAINNAGQVVGTDDDKYAFITGPNGKGAAPLAGFGRYTTPHDINDAGVVVGKSDSKAFITDPGGQNMREIVMPEANIGAEAISVNNAGRVVGVYYTPSPTSPFDYHYHGFITDAGGLNARRLDGFDPTRTRLVAINASGQVAGFSRTETSWVPRSFVTGPDGVGLTELDPGDADSISVEGINDNGDFGGVAAGYDGNLYNPFVSRANGPMKIKRNLGGRDAFFGAINLQRDIVGTSTRERGFQRAFISTWNGEPWQIDKFVANLPAGAVFTMANGINDRRQVIVAGSGGYIVCSTENCE